MGRAARIEFEGAKYHVMARGNWRAEIFHGPADYTRFLVQLRYAAEQERIHLFAFAVMPNHYHLFLETPQANLRRFMQRLNTAYSLYFRNRTQRPGHCFQGRYACQLVAGNDYCLRLTRYIHLNPVKTRAFEHADRAAKLACLRAYDWSSYAGYVSAAHALPWVNYRWLGLMGGVGPEPYGQEVSGLGKLPEYRDFSGPDTHGRMEVSGLEKSGAAGVFRGLTPVETSGVRPGQLAAYRDVSGSDTDKRSLYARYIEGFLGEHDDLVKEDNETGALLDNSALGDDGSPSPVSGLEKSRYSGSFQRPDTAAQAQVSGPDNSRGTVTSPVLTPPHLRFDQITAVVASTFGLKEKDLFTHGLHASAAKSAAVELACRYTGLKQFEVGQLFGYASETSVGKQRRRIAALLAATPDVADCFAAAETRLLALAASGMVERPGLVGVRSCKVARGCPHEGVWT